MDFNKIAQADTPIELLVGFEAQMDEGEDSHLVASLPDTDARFAAKQRTMEMRRLVWRRLYSLGYAPTANLSSNTPRTRSHTPSQRYRQRQQMLSRYTKAVETFQGEAGTPQDGVVGLHTWERLQQLITFEHDTNLTSWFAPKYSGLLKRAVELRLRRLGLVSEHGTFARATGNQQVVNEGLSRLHDILLRIAPDKVSPTTSEKVIIEWLFDIDRLTKTVANGFELLTLQDTNKTDLYFVRSLLKVELWLFGQHELVPSERKDVMNYPFQYVERNQRKTSGIMLATSVSNFLDETATQVPPAKHSDEICVLKIAFNTLASLDDEQQNQKNARQRSEILLGEIQELKNRKQKSLFSKALKSISAFGEWLYDGIKRGFRWLVSLFHKATNASARALRKSREYIKRLAATAKKMASEAMVFARRTFHILTDGFEFLCRKEYWSEKGQIGIYKKLDMDMIVAVDQRATPAHLEQFWQSINHRIIRSRAALVITSWIVEVVKEIALLFTGGVVSLIGVLIKLYQGYDSDEARIIKQAYATFQHDRSPAVQFNLGSKPPAHPGL